MIERAENVLSDVVTTITKLTKMRKELSNLRGFVSPYQPASVDFELAQDAIERAINNLGSAQDYIDCVLENHAQELQRVEEGR